MKTHRPEHPSIRRLPTCRTSEVQAVCNDFLATGIPRAVTREKLGISTELCDTCPNAVNCRTHLDEEFGTVTHHAFSNYEIQTGHYRRQ